MRPRRFMQLDVFSPTPYQGNPLAVVLDGEGLSDAQMQDFAHWTNLSETTFLLPPTTPEADYRVRIFTPSNELPFAGHPTLGSCQAWLAAGGQPAQAGRVVQECAKGLVALQPLATDRTVWSFAAPSTRRQPISEAQLLPVLQALQLPREAVLACQQLDNGPNFWALLLRDADSVFAAQPDFAALYAMQVEVGLAALYPRQDAAPGLIARSSREARAFAQSSTAEAAEPDIEVRAFFNATTTACEDPITGSFNASLAQWLIDAGHIQAPYLASQGVALGRQGLVHIEQDAAGQVWVGGQVSLCVQGTVQL
ncbi:PhzF family phenazine biosynthesis protein [Comamonas humi]